ncbi:Polyadenylate-binding protein 4 (PABP-4) (Poly(A)-binding protein 4) [Durusdinium trenchii]|uniref:Polyadenylate-binding protein 4 (PABP-4) (Poly(A)-binding protein 4) n=1 Tax=Durusdinium trenchii TaxID=1381693 RepID=A0ABP0SLN1_9DINO
MGGQQSSDAPQEDTKVEEKTEPPKAEAVQAPKSEPEKQEAKDSEGKKNYSKMPDTKKASPKETKSQPKAPVPPGAQSSGSLAKQLAKQAPKAAAPKKKVQQPGPPQQPGLITPESAAKAKGKGEKGKGGKGKGFQGIQLCVRNLAKEATPDQLKGMFQPFGELLNVDVKKNTDGTCRGYGFVTFSSMEEAKKAISQMDNKQVEGKSLVVVLSDRQQGTTKAEREAQAPSGPKGKGKDGKGPEGKGKGGAKGKMKGAAPQAAPSPLPAPPQPAWPYAQAEGTYPTPYNYAYPMVSPMAAYASQGYQNPQAAAQALALQAQLAQAHQQAIQSQAAWYGAPVAAQEARPNLNQEYEGSLKSISTLSEKCWQGLAGWLELVEWRAHYQRDVFVDSALLPEGIQVNDKVTFALALSEKGHPRATSVKLIGQAGECHQCGECHPCLHQ